MSDDPWVLGTVRGYRIPFHSQPFQSAEPGLVKLADLENQALQDEMVVLQQTGAIEPVTGVPKFVSPLFVIPKQDGKWRVIFNLKRLNQCVQVEHFKMQSLSDLPDLLTHRMFLCKLDLKNAYHSISVDPRDRPFLCFRHPSLGTLWQYTCLPFGLADAPRAFTKILSPVVAHLRGFGCQVITYLDDWLLTDSSKTHLGAMVQKTIHLLEELGFTVNRQKSVLSPSTSLIFLGMSIDTVAMTATWPGDKAKKVQHECSRILRKQSISVAELWCLLGKMEASRFAVPVAPPLHYRGLQYLLHDNLVPNSVLDHLPPVPLSPWAQTDLVWWTSATPSTFRSSLLVPPVTVSMATDASRAGWGAVCGNRTTGGRWHPDESKNHINWLEMRAVQLGLQAFVSQIHDTSIRLEVDNVSTVAFLNRKGGTRSQRLCHLAQEIWEWALSRSLVLVAVHVPGKSNTVADHQSRHFQRTPSDWMLNPALFRELETLLGPFKVDLFAARHNAQLKSYCSWSHDPWAIATDAFSMPALWENAYAFPPFHLVGRCLRLVREFRVRRILLVAPAWARQPWYSLLLTMLVSTPILLESAHVLLGPEGELHPVHQRLHMVAWPISGHPSDCVAFRTELRSCGCEAWRSSTSKSYDSAWRKWERWCGARSVDPFHADLPVVANFLGDMFGDGYQYRTLNVYRSALSSVLPTVDGIPVGQHSDVCKVMRGVYNSRPPQPRYSSTWEVGPVLEALRGWGPNTNLSLSKLSQKLVLLLALACAPRAREIQLLQADRVLRKPDGVSLFLSAPTKTQHSGTLKEFFHFFFC